LIGPSAPGNELVLLNGPDALVTTVGWTAGGGAYVQAVAPVASVPGP
jgi:hypothetical protein